jgi:hypothetical protein
LDIIKPIPHKLGAFMTDALTHLDLLTPDLAEAKKQELLRLF